MTVYLVQREYPFGDEWVTDTLGIFSTVEQAEACVRGRLTSRGEYRGAGYWDDGRTTYWYTPYTLDVEEQEIGE